MTVPMLDSGVLDIDAKTAIALVNMDVMKQAAARYVLKQPSLKMEQQVMLSIVASQTYSWNGQATTMITLGAGAKWLERGIGAVDRILRKMQNDTLVQRQDENKATVSHWRLKNLAVKRAMEKIADLNIKIAEVVALQLANPDDESAGRDLVPAEVYYNVVANKKARDADPQAAIEAAEANIATEDEQE